MKRRIIQGLLISLCVIIIIIFVILLLSDSLYLSWDYSNLENAVLGVAFHIFEWLFVRMAPIIFVSSIVGIILIRKKV